MMAERMYSKREVGTQEGGGGGGIDIDKIEEETNFIWDKQRDKDRKRGKNELAFS